MLTVYATSCLDIILFTHKKMEFHIKPGFELNPNKRVVDSIVKAIERNGGECPCHNDSEDKMCPCSNWRLHSKCCCHLYVPKAYLGDEDKADL